ncbi:PREDICTED: uncharacterized protein LOC109474408 [Branchiostoma belcheri]|uniref:Uncharacterized protein LOC109474408 n=1 Tax=Branchiostoma belcheri TaxID=7741 RepID=A0A6P4Z159_BRABE|nr:PREDICTED: uncharacterized protein LOC109474408 [Branchiostoma belcheri]
MSSGPIFSSLVTDSSRSSRKKSDSALGTEFTLVCDRVPLRDPSPTVQRFLCFVFDNGSGAMSTLPIDVGGEGISLSDMKEVKAMPHIASGCTAVCPPPLPPKPGKDTKQVILWGGLDKRRWCCSNDLTQVDITITPKTTTAKVSILPGDKQDGVPSPRTGHTLVAISSLQAILFGGLELASRHVGLGTCAQSCKDGYFYLLDMTTLRWNKLPLPPLVPRAYDSSTWVPASSTMVIVGGITYSGHCPSERLSVSDVVCLKVSDTSQYTLTEIHMEGRELLQTLNQRDAQ